MVVTEYWGSTENLNYDWAELAYIYPKGELFGDPIHGIRCAYKNISVDAGSMTVSALVSKVAEWVLLKAREQRLVDFETLNKEYRPHFVKTSMDRKVLYDDEKAVVTAVLANPAKANLTWYLPGGVTNWRKINDTQWYFVESITGEPESYGPGKTTFIEVKSDRILGDEAVFTFEYRNSENR